MEAEMFKTLKGEFVSHPVVSNVLFGFILVGVEKMLEVEFACPCNPTWNKIFVAPFFLVPAFTATVLMMLIQGFQGYQRVLCSFLPPIVWLALMLLNGQYVVCAMTDWPGTFVDTGDTYLKWCKPSNTSSYSAEELLDRSHRFYILSQGIGNAIVSLILVLLVIYIVYQFRSKQNGTCERCGSTEKEDPEILKLNPKRSKTNTDKATDCSVS